MGTKRQHSVMVDNNSGTSEEGVPFLGNEESGSLSEGNEAYP